MSPAVLVGAGVVFGRDLVGRGSRTRTLARPDEDAVTLAVQAGGEALPEQVEVGALVLATTTPPYESGGSAQPLAEMLDLQGGLFTVELTATARDGLAALRLGAALVGTLGNVLVVAAHAAEDGSSGSGAVALLLSDPDCAPDGAGLATVEPLAGVTTELRDRWRLAHRDEVQVADSSFVEAIATTHLDAQLAALLPTPAGRRTVTGPHARAAAVCERAADGPGDDLAAHVGTLGAAHPLLRLLHGLDAPTVVTALAGGIADAVAVNPTAAGTAYAARLRAAAPTGPVLSDQGRVTGQAAGFAPSTSLPRAWRERDVDLRLRGILNDGAPAPGRTAPRGTVLTWTRDHVYPSAQPVEVVAVDLDQGGRFFGQVATGEHVAIGDRVELVPRRLHEGGQMIQYFWKVQPCR